MPKRVRTSTLAVLTMILLVCPIQALDLHQAKMQLDGGSHVITTPPLDLAQYAVDFDGGITVSIEVPRGVERAQATVTTPTGTRTLNQIKQRATMPPGPDDTTTWLTYIVASPEAGFPHTFRFEVRSNTPFDFTRILLGQPSTPTSRIIGASSFVPRKGAMVIKAGEDLLGTRSARQFIQFPAGFLGIGVEAFSGMVEFGEDPFMPDVNNVDTVMLRLHDVAVGGTVPVRLLRFQNRTLEPLTVQSATGPQHFQIRASLSPNAVSEGFVTINADGSYRSSTSLYPLFEIQRVDDGGSPVGSPVVIDTALMAVPGFPFYLASSGGQWTDQAPEGRLVTPGSSNFFYNNGDSNLFNHSNGRVLRGSCDKSSAITTRK
ncbi:MAG: hypothetical protein GY719_09995 [bacterium]|nr:hypothetical protein [bacterium]